MDGQLERCFEIFSDSGVTNIEVAREAGVTPQCICRVKKNGQCSPKVRRKILLFAQVVAEESIKRNELFNTAVNGRE